MADDRLRLTAELIDRVSGPAKKMQKAFEDMNKSTAKDLPAAFRRYQASVQANEKALEVYGKRTLSVGRELKGFQDIVRRVSPAVGGLTDEIAAFSVGAGTAIGTLGAFGVAALVAAKSAGSFAEAIRDLRFGSRESGLGMTQLKELTVIAPHFGMSVETMTKATVSFRSVMADAAANAGKFVDSFADLGPGGVKLAAPLIAMARAGKSTSEELETVFETIDKLKKDFPGARGEDLARRYVQHLGLPPEFGRMGAAEVREQLKNSLFDRGLWQSTIGMAERFQKTMEDTAAVMENLKNLFQRSITPALEDSVREFNAIADALKKIDAFVTKWTGTTNPGAFGGLGTKFREWLLGGGSGGSSPTAPGGGTFADQPYAGRSGFGTGFGTGGLPGGDGGRGGFHGGGPGGPGGDPRGALADVRAAAIAEGINPDYAERVARAEGLGAAYGVGDRGTSFGAMQLHRGGAGSVGTEFERQTGLNLADPANEGAASRFAMKWVKAHGWGAWMGAAKAGITGRMGVGIDTSKWSSDSGGNAGGIGQQMPTTFGRLPASICTNNPGAQWPKSGDKRFGATGYMKLPDGNLIEVFGDPSGGAAANMDLFKKGYTGMSFGAAGKKWTGGHGFGVPGYDPNMVVTKEMMNDPKFVIPMMKAIAGREAGRASPLTDDQWNNAFNMFQAGGTTAGMDRLNLNQALSGAPAQISGGADLDVKVTAPPGTSVRTGNRGIFQRVRTQRNIQMTPANSGPPDAGGAPG